MSNQIAHVSDATFETEVLQSALPVLLDFWADWCAPCRVIAPLLDELSREFEGRIRIAKLNVEDNRLTPARYNVKAIPTLILFRDGEAEAVKVGQVGKAQLSAFIGNHL
jgi:thioredoxin 1